MLPEGSNKQTVCCENRIDTEDYDQLKIMEIHIHKKMLFCKNIHFKKKGSALKN